MESTTLDLDLVTGLYRTTNAAVRELDQRLGKEHDITFIQAVTLLAIDSFDRPQPHLVADYLSQQSQTVTGVLDRLERAGHVTRRRDLGDRRAVRLELTASGHALVRDMSETPSQARRRGAERAEPCRRGSTCARTSESSSSPSGPTASMKRAGMRSHCPARLCGVSDVVALRSAPRRRHRRARPDAASRSKTGTSRLDSVASLCEAIVSLRVRGAPLLGLAGRRRDGDRGRTGRTQRRDPRRRRRAHRLGRPTAVDLARANSRGAGGRPRRAGRAAAAGALWSIRRRALRRRAAAEDRRIGELGAALLPPGTPRSSRTATPARSPPAASARRWASSGSPGSRGD